jgi:hypothetical protein
MLLFSCLDSHLISMFLQITKMDNLLLIEIDLKVSGRKKILYIQNVVFAAPGNT